MNTIHETVFVATVRKMRHLKVLETLQGTPFKIKDLNEQYREYKKAPALAATRNGQTK